MKSTAAARSRRWGKRLAGSKATGLDGLPSRIL